MRHNSDFGTTTHGEGLHKDEQCALPASGACVSLFYIKPRFSMRIPVAMGSYTKKLHRNVIRFSSPGIKAFPLFLETTTACHALPFVPQIFFPALLLHPSPVHLLALGVGHQQPL